MKLQRRQVLTALVAFSSAASTFVSLPALALGEVRDLDEPGPPAGPPWPNMTSKTVFSADGTPIFYREGGRGAVTVLFIHGWSCNHQFFGPQFASVTADYKVLALDLAGHGQSGARAEVSVEGFAQDVAAVAATTDGPLVLVAHSTGGRVVCAVAKRLGDRLLGAIGIDTFHNLGQPMPDEQVIVEAVAARRADFVGSTRDYVSIFFKDGSDPAVVAWVKDQMTATDPAQAIAAMEAFARFDAREAITGWSRPVIALNSDWVPINYKEIQGFLPGFDMLILAGRGHFPNLDDPLIFNGLLLATLNRLVH
jgi:pimeloyl-ACP methyl ester carboxylesterase